jgi:hypothetical protein
MQVWFRFDSQENGQQSGFMAASVACFDLYDHSNAAAA